MDPALRVAEQHQQLALREVFTPTRPQRSSRRVAGRQRELLRIFQAIAMDRAHVVLYGERGRGKTSLVNLVASAARSAGYMVGRYACAADSDFDQIVRGLARDLPRSLLAVPVTEGNLEGCEAALPAGPLQPRDIAALPGRMAGRHLVLIVDEFDRVEDGPTRTRFADTIKQVSDRAAPVSFVIVGVSDSLEELLGRHPSIQRNILGLPLPLLPDNEIEAIVEHGGRDAGLDYPSPIRAAIAAYAQGVPYIAQLLGLHAGSAALSRNARSVTEEDFAQAIRQAAAEADPRVITLYQTVTKGGRDRRIERVLWAIAEGPQDRFGRFVVEGDGEQVLIAGVRVDMEQWQRLVELGVVRACPHAGPELFTFTEAMLRHYILLRRSLYDVPNADAPAALRQA